MNMGYLQYQFTIIAIYNNSLFDDFINIDFILCISNSNFMYYYSSKEGQENYCYSIIVNIQNEDISIKVLTKNSVLYIYSLSWYKYCTIFPDFLSHCCVA